MKKLKILQINKLYYPVTGGIEKVVQQIAEGLADQTDMRILVCQKKGKAIIEKVNGIEVFRAGSLGTYFSMPISLSFILRLRQLSQDRDVLHFHMPFPLADLTFWLWRMKNFKGKVILWWHSDIIKQKRLKQLLRPFTMCLLKRANAIIVATEGHIEGSKDLWKFKDKCIIIPFGLDRIHEDGLNLEAASETENTLSPVEFLFVGRLVYYKGCDVLLRAFAQTKGGNLTIAGDGPLKEEMQQQVNTLGIAKQVQFKGEISDKQLIECYKKCDVFVLPSIAPSEAFGLVQIEAMAYGKPVINTYLSSGVPHVSIDNITGLTVQPNQPEALAEAMQKMIDEPELRKRFGFNAKEMVRSKYRMDIMLKKVLELYES